MADPDPPPEPPAAVCPNCQAPLTGVYCAACGQHNIDLERPIWSLAGELIRETFELDGRTARTLKALFRHPGLLTCEYVAGRRRHYVSPLRLYLVISIAFFVVVAWFAEDGVLLDPGQDLVRDAALQAQFLSDDLPKLMFVLLPVFALLLKAAYARRLYIEHLIFALHLHTASYVILAAMVPLERVAEQHLVLLLVQSAIFVYFILYLVVAVRRVYESGWWVAAGKSLAVLLGYFAVLAVLIENLGNFRIIAD